MADISKCAGVACPLKNDCYRFLATENPHRQSYLVRIPFDKERKWCDDFMPSEDK